MAVVLWGRIGVWDAATGPTGMILIAAFALVRPEMRVPSNGSTHRFPHYIASLSAAFSTRWGRDGPRPSSRLACLVTDFPGAGYVEQGKN